MKETQILMMLIISLSLSSSKHWKQKQRKQKQKQNPSKQIIRKVHRSQEFLDQQKINNEQADKIHSINKEGRDNTSETLKKEGKIFVRIKSKLSEEQDESDEFQEYYYKLNSNSLYFLYDQDYRNVVKGIDLLEIPAKSDNIQQLQCCMRIQETNHVNIEKYDFKGYCFKVSMLTQEFLLCLHKQNQLEELKEELKQAVIESYYAKHLPFLQLPRILRNQYHQELDWIDQQSWKGMCQEHSQQQSPIKISSYTKVENDNLAFHFHDISSIKYTLLNNQVQFYGEFGSFTHFESSSSSKYFISHIVFKLQGSEHKLTDSPFNPQSELQIYAVDSDLNYAVLSIMLSINTQNNLFIDNMNLQNMFDVDTTYKCLKTKSSLNLNQLFTYSDILTDFSFYYYQGSLNTPPCNRNVQYIVMENSANINHEQLRLLIVKTLKSINIENNIRKVQVQLSNTIVYYVQFKCKLPQPLPQPVEEENVKFLKATQHFQHYAMTNDDKQKELIENVFKTHTSKGQNKIQVGDYLSISKVKENDVPLQARYDLHNRWNHLYTQGLIQDISKRKLRRFRR